MSEVQQLTVKEALEQGYVYCSNEEGEYFGRIDKVTPENFLDVDYYVTEKDPFLFKLSAETIKEIIENHLDNQDEVYDEDMCDMLDEVDFEAVAALINSCFKKNYYMPTEIKLIL